MSDLCVQDKLTGKLAEIHSTFPDLRSTVKVALLAVGREVKEMLDSRYGMTSFAYSLVTQPR